MALELSPEQQAVLKDTAPAKDPTEFQALLKAAEPEMNRVVREIMEPSQPIDTTVIELRDLLLTVDAYTMALDAVSYGPERRTLFRDSIRLVATAGLWFSEGARMGAFRTRSVEEVIQASRPWRARLKAFGAQAFVFEPDIAEQFADINSTGTLAEEKEDLRILISLVDQYQAQLMAVGMKPGFANEGKTLLDEASGRDLVAILGLRNREEASALRNRIVTYATMMGREARAAGLNGCFDNPEASRRFEAASFRNALRRLKPRRRGGSQEDAPAEEPKGNPPGGGSPG
jgi:hypothetical protein